jgi:hypothetical protein
MTRLLSVALASAALFVSTVAAAGPLEDRAATLLAEAIDLAQKGDFDKWINTYCDPERCHTDLSKDQWKAYQLKQLKEQGKFCVTDGKVEVSRWRGELGVAPNKAKAYVTCTNRQLPPPVEFRYDAAADKIWIRALSI